MAMNWPRLLNPNRRRTSTTGSDHREQFERDYDRTVFSTPVKRLQDKAQVFPLEPHDAIRTRLTHSLEVSAVARGLSTRVAAWLTKEKPDGFTSGMDRQVEAIAATCGLIHDLGNPPFGHAGELAIQEWFKHQIKEESLRARLNDREQLVQDFLKFEGNAQTLRLVARLQILADEYGLNLTFGTLSAACKYTAPSDHAGEGTNRSYKKPGFFASENALIASIREATGTGTARNPITYLVEAADDIVYSVADIEDAVKKGVLTWNEVEGVIRDESHGVPKAIADDVLERKDRILKAGRDKVPDNLPADIHASALRTAAIAISVEAAATAFENRYRQIMDGLYESDLASDCQTTPLIDLFKKIGQQRVYCTHATIKLELMGRRVIHDLMDLFWEGAQALPTDKAPRTKDFPGRLGALLSENYRTAFRHSVQNPNSDLPEDYYRFQLVTDYVCGMTDSFAKRLHAELTNG